MWLAQFDASQWAIFCFVYAFNEYIVLVAFECDVEFRVVACIV